MSETWLGRCDRFELAERLQRRAVDRDTPVANGEPTHDEMMQLSAQLRLKETVDFRGSWVLRYLPAIPEAPSSDPTEVVVRIKPDSHVMLITRSE